MPGYKHTQWGAEGRLRALGADQIACALYECPDYLTDTQLASHDKAWLQAKGRFPAERISLTLRMVNSAGEILVTVCAIHAYQSIVFVCM